MLSSHFDFAIMGSTVQSLCQKLVSFAGILWFSVSTYFLPLFRSFRTCLFRFKGGGSSSEGNSNHSDIASEENSKKDSNPIEPKPVLQPQIDTEVEAKRDSVNSTDGFGEEETSEFCFKFRFQTYEEFSRSRRENGDFIGFKASPETTTEKFKPFNGLSDENIDFVQIYSKPKASQGEVPDDSTRGLPGDGVEKIERMAFAEDKGKQVDAGGDRNAFDEVHLHSEKDSFDMDSDSGSMSSSPMRSIVNRLIDSYSDGFLSDDHFGGEFEIDDSIDLEREKGELNKEMSDLDENHLDDLSEEQTEDCLGREDTYTMEELRKLEEVHLQNLGKLNSNFLSEKDFHEEKDNSKHGRIGGHNDKALEATHDSGKVNSKNASDWGDSDDSNKLESLWEHQELIEQLKMELKKVRATGLPTILEESESPKVAEDLRPWKIDEKFLHADRMDNLHKFYKSYRERMRKFDILNYQKMYAIGFLQLKDPLQSISSCQKSSVPSILSLCKRKKVGSVDPTMRFVKELQSDLEVVYVGQMCLSWEILHWQYGKALELWESDPRGIRQYNEVAGEFQQFQVLLQRFIEDEPFQGPRVQNFVKSRCVLRNLLQVPHLRVDSTKDRKKAIKRREIGDYAITSDVLVEIMEESIRIFWRFVRADKDCTNVIAKCRRPHVELQDPADSELLIEVRTALQKKEKKLKDLLRAGNCILKRFQKCQEDDSDSDQVLYFFSQVDMKLVSRALNMSRITTEQLLWCRNKLTKISFANRKIHVEPSFLLFPC